MNPLTRKAMLVRMSIHSWRGRKIDRNAAKAAAAAMNIEVGGDEYYKFLVPKPAFKPIMNLHTTIRLYHASLTFPWFDDGLRVLPAAKFFEYTQRMHVLKDEQNKYVEEFLSNYEQYKAYARANRQLVFNEKDYPSIDELRDSFSVELNFLPFPDANDFRVELDSETLNELKAQVVSEQSRVIKLHRDEMLGRLTLKLYRLWDMCEAPTVRIYDATVDTFKETVEMAENLNVMEDSKIKTVVAACKTWLTSINPETLRNRPEIRGRVVDAAKEILEILKDGS